MAIFGRKNKSGTIWGIDLYLPDGSRYRKTVGRTKKQAQVVERKIKTQIADGTWGIKKKPDITFADFLDKYFEYTETNRSASTHRIHKYVIEANLLPYFGKYKLREIPRLNVERYKTHRLSQDVVRDTVNHELKNLSHILTMAVKWEYIDKNVVKGVERFKVPEKPPRFLSLQEIGQLLDAAGESYIYPLIVTALHTGMRKSELLNLKWSGVDFEQNTITIQSDADWHTKNYKSREVDMTPVLRDVLQKQWHKHLELGIEVDYVFTYQGNRLKDARHSIKTVFQKAELQDATLHTLRHTFASQLVMAGVSLMVVQKLMGHARYETTLRYAHLSPEHVKKQVEKLPYSSMMVRNWSQNEKQGGDKAKNPASGKVLKLNASRD